VRTLDINSSCQGCQIGRLAAKFPTYCRGWFKWPCNFCVGRLPFFDHFHGRLAKMLRCWPFLKINRLCLYSSTAIPNQSQPYHPLLSESESSFLFVSFSVPSIVVTLLLLCALVNDHVKRSAYDETATLCYVFCIFQAGADLSNMPSISCL